MKVKEKLVKNSFGFTLIELLAAIVIMGVLMGVSVPAVTKVLRNSKNMTYVDDGIRLVSTFQQQMNKDNMMPVPGVHNCIAMNLTYLDNNTFDEAPYGGEYHRLYSFVVAKRENLSNYKYYVRLVEQLPSGDDGFRGIDLSEVDKLYESDAKDVSVKSIGKSALYSLSDYSTNTGDLISELSSYGISCDQIIIYAPNGEKSE